MSTRGVPNRERVTTFRANRARNGFTFFRTGVQPFLLRPEAWQPGGLGRLRIVVVKNGNRNACASLPVLDRDGQVPANATTIVVADSTPDPTNPLLQSDAEIRDASNPHTPDYLAANLGVDLSIDTSKYYDHVLIDPDGTGEFIHSKLGSLTDFKNRYFAPLSGNCSAGNLEGRSRQDEPTQVATYFNKGDLGIGREMHCPNRGCAGELVCYVRNFAKTEAVCRPTEPDCSEEPVFDDKDGAQGASNHAFATVAMVERQHMDRTAANRVFFVVYGRDAKLLFKAQLDNKAFNTSIPGNCLQCHGSNSSYKLGDNDRPEVTNAFFPAVRSECLRVLRRASAQAAGTGVSCV